jgi:hypothetical protein
LRRFDTGQLEPVVAWLGRASISSELVRRADVERFKIQVERGED